MNCVTLLKDYTEGCSALSLWIIFSQSAMKTDIPAVEKKIFTRLFRTLIEEQVWGAIFHRKVARKKVVISLQLSQWIFSQHPIHDLNLILKHRKLVLPTSIECYIMSQHRCYSRYVALPYVP